MDWMLDQKLLSARRHQQHCRVYCCFNGKVRVKAASKLVQLCIGDEMSVLRWICGD
jgi:hypothetical protein